MSRRAGYSRQNNNITVRTPNSNYVRVKICNNYVIGLLDSGCGMSVVANHFVKKMGWHVENLEEEDLVNLLAANGTSIKVQGKITISLKIGGLVIPFDFLVVEELRQNLILGNDFLNATKAVINYRDGTVSFYDDLVRLNFLSKDYQIAACLNKDCILDPYSETIVEVYLSKPVIRQCVLLEPLVMREKQQYLIARSLVNPEGKLTICRLLNPTGQILNLRRHLQVASVQLIDVNSITVFDTQVNESG